MKKKIIEKINKIKSWFFEKIRKEGREGGRKEGRKEGRQSGCLQVRKRAEPSPETKSAGTLILDFQPLEL